ncbi:hypothetical protein NQ318_001759 [Aromia moschata]|uniref:WASH1 WAHD domain-containing protein n=1 Tax=Aromia moschata TaxID=1265417 RepID=A0AAV8XS66_9CUCU|nr:hypothetical protein NQ318_001759 [Aromia moschata]
MNPNYTVPIIPQNLSKQETIIQIAEVLDHLTNVTEGIFTQVQKRLNSNKGKLADISERVEVVKKKINKLKGAKKGYAGLFNSTSAYEPLDKLQFYHVNIPSDNKKEKLEGLGEIPLDINCVNDLLLYNTGKNLYKNFVIADALKGPQNIREEEDRDYRALDVPLDLPDLPGIADDLHYENEIGPGIAPSAVVTPNIIENIVDLPAIVQSEPEPKEADIPTPPPFEELPESVPKQSVDVQVELSSEIPKPPEVTEPKINLPPQNDMRSSLMEAIRSRGFGKSKITDGDLMADLRLKLLDRRKGISGTKKPEVVDPDSTLGKISAMIPPPEPKNDVESTSNDEEDWE